MAAAPLFHFTAMRKLILTAAIALTAACVSAPPVTIDTEHGLVRASTREQAERVADALAVAPRVRDTLHATRADLPVLWVVEHDLGAARAVCYERRIELKPSAVELKPSAVEYYVAHELVHWYMPGSSFDGLPHFVEEGLADFVALQLFGLVSARERENAAIGSVTVPTAALDADSRVWFTLPDETKLALTRLGFTVVSRLGMDGLQTRAAASEGPWSYLQGAGIDIETTL